MSRNLTSDLFKKIKLGTYEVDYISLPLDPILLTQYSSLYRNDTMNSWASGRIQEFLGVRACSDKSLSFYQLDHFKVLKKQSGAPIWPPGLIGSLTHSKSFCMSVCCENSNILGLGLDCEMIVKDVKREFISDKVLRDEDFHTLKSVKHYSPLNDNEIFTLIFSAKESLYKCLNPITDIYFGFEHAFVEKIDFESSSFSIILNSKLDDLKPYNGKYSGAFKKLDNCIVTLVELVKK